MGLNSPIIFSVWINKPLMATKAMPVPTANLMPDVSVFLSAWPLCPACHDGQHGNNGMRRDHPGAFMSGSRFTFRSPSTIAPPYRHAETSYLRAVMRYARSDQHFNLGTGERNAFGAVAGKFIHDRQISLTRRLPHLSDTEFFKNDPSMVVISSRSGINVSIPNFSARRLL